MKSQKMTDGATTIEKLMPTAEELYSQMDSELDQLRYDKLCEETADRQQPNRNVFKYIKGDLMHFVKMKTTGKPF